MTTDTVTSQRYQHTAQVDEAAYSAFVANEARAIRRRRDRGNTLFAGLTDPECADMAASVCSSYRHQFRVLAPAA